MGVSPRWETFWERRIRIVARVTERDVLVAKETKEERKLREALLTEAVKTPAKPTEDKLKKILDKAKKNK